MIFVLTVVIVLGGAEAKSMGDPLDRQRAALGGDRAIEKARRMRLRWREELYGLQGTSVEIVDGVRLRSELHIAEIPLDEVDLFDGQRLLRQGTNGDVRVRGARETADKRTEVSLTSLAWLRRDGGMSLKWLEPTSDGGQRFERMEVSASGGTPVVLWVDETGLLRRYVKESSGVITVTRLEDYQDHGGLRLPGRTITRRSTESQDHVAKLESVEFLSAVETAWFAPFAGRQDSFFPEGRAAVTLPLELLDGAAIIVDGTLSGRAGRFLLDTGASATAYDFEWLESLGIQPKGRVVPAAGAFRGISFARVPELLLHGMRLMPQTVLAIDFHYAGGFPKGVNGLLGYDFVSRFPFTVDYAAKTITFWKPGGYLPSDGEIAVPFELDSTVVKVAVRCNGGAPEWFSVDTGNGSFSTVQHVRNARALIPAGPRAYRLPQGVQFGSGAAAGFLTHADLELVAAPQFRWKAAPVMLLDPDDPHASSVAGAGSLGVEWLEHFRLTFDYARSRLWLKLQKPFAPASAWGRLGLTTQLHDDRVSVGHVVPGWPAAQAGVQKGDEIVAVDGKPAHGDAITAMLALRDVAPRAARHIELRRGDRKLNVTITAAAGP